MKTATKHTPGKWHISQAMGEDMQPLYVVSNDGTAIAQMRGMTTNDRWSNETKANATLIAAAPELLAALRPLASIAIECWPHDKNYFDVSMHREFVQRARAAIAKVKGQP